MKRQHNHSRQKNEGIIFEDGCNELNRWLDKFFLKILTRRPPDSFIKFQEEHTEQDPLVLIENLLEYLTDECGLNLIDETESVGKILEDLLQNRYMQRSWTKKANEPVCISMNEANLHLNKITEHLNELDLKKKLLAELYVS
ncbi:unnamed protein product [Trichobilharzia regenti]|nr:unnamed protein product [Trichobilharzia regenti]